MSADEVSYVTGSELLVDGGVSAASEGEYDAGRG